MSKIKDLAEAVTAEFAHGAFSQAFTAERGYVAQFTTEEFHDLRVVVAPGAFDSDAASRGAVTQKIGIDIGIMKKVGNDVGQVDELVILADDIRRFFNGRELENMPTATIVGAAQIKPLYDAAELKTNRLFISVVRLTYFVGE